MTDHHPHRHDLEKGGLHVRVRIVRHVLKMTDHHATDSVLLLLAMNRPPGARLQQFPKANCQSWW
jgi:hypothetical protein